MSDTIKVLDDGFVKLIQHSGSDNHICAAARLTSGIAGKDDRGLLRYLMRHRHATPLEFCNLTFHIRIPMDAWRQFVRHRLLSINEYSTRYSDAIDSAQTTPPDQWRAQATSNRQGSDGMLGLATGACLTDQEATMQRMARSVYTERLEAGVAREQARKDLPLSTYTEAWVECDLRGWLHFLGLRMDSHAQKEIRDYANAIAEFIKQHFPLVFEAFQDYELNAITLTALDIAGIRKIMEMHSPGISKENHGGWANKREETEFFEKLERLGIKVSN